MLDVKRSYRGVAGAFCLLAVVTQYFLIVGGETGAALATRTVHFFSFFTILSNLLAAAALLLPVALPGSGVSQFLSRPSVRTAIAGYMVIVGVVYYALLRDVSQAEGLRLFFERSLHYLTPPLFVLDWLIFVPKTELPWSVGPASLGFPAAYAAWTFIHGAATGWYPYPFLDVGELGYPRAIWNAAWLVAAFLVLELALVGLGRLTRRP